MQAQVLAPASPAAFGGVERGIHAELGDGVGMVDTLRVVSTSSSTLTQIYYPQYLLGRPHR